MDAKLKKIFNNLNNDFSHYLNKDKKKLTDEEYLIRETCENSFYEFTKHAWKIIEGNAIFRPGWHLEAICAHLEALYKLQINRLIINLPPRLGKSNVCSVLYCAWVWTKEPHYRFLYSAYAQKLSVRDSEKCLSLIQSHWYQKLWGHKFKISSKVASKLRFNNNKTGYRIASSIGGSNTGEGAHFEICDDPNNVKTVESEVTRENTNNWYDFVMSSRYSGTIDQFRRLLIQQRTNPEDVTGHVLSKDDKRWVHLCLPMEFEESRRCKTIILPNTKKIWQDPRKKEGEIIWPAGINKKDLELLKQKDFKNNPHIIAGQLQQRPFLKDGGILKAAWFKPWEERDLPNFEYVIQSWDTALTTTRLSGYSACTTWGAFKDRTGINNIMLISLFKEKVEYPDLRKAAIRLAYNYFDSVFDSPLNTHSSCPPNLILIEQKVNGYSLLQDLMRANLPVMKFNPNNVGDKTVRCRIISHLIENGLVWLPTEAPNFKYYTKESQTFLEAATQFPKGDGIDLIDSMSQAFIRLTGDGWVYNKEDPIIYEQSNWSAHNRPYY